MPKAVIDTTVLVSAFLRLNVGGVSTELLHFAERASFDLFLSPQILDELKRVLLTKRHLRARYQYDDAAALEFTDGVAELATVITDLPDVKIVRDPTDDMIIACAIAAGADYLVTRDKDLLSLGSHGATAIITPEAFLGVLRSRPAS